MPTPDRFREDYEPEPIERPTPEEYMDTMLHYDPRQTRALNAAAVAGSMRDRVPDAQDAEVYMAARGLARSQDFATVAAADFWAGSVLVTWRLGDTDRPF